MGWTTFEWLRRAGDSRSNRRASRLTARPTPRPRVETESVSDLVARKKFGRALVLLRAQFEAGNRSPELRLQFADVLVQSGKAAEAVPVLIGVADEVAGVSRERAIEALRRVEKIEPGREDVAMRLATLRAEVR